MSLVPGCRIRQQAYQLSGQLQEEGADAPEPVAAGDKRYPQERASYERVDDCINHIH